MIAKNKQDFITTWENSADEIRVLYNTAKSFETMAEIKETIKDLKVLIRQVADEGYQTDSSKE